MAGEELSAEIGGQKLSLKNLPINTIATIATLIGVSLIGYMVWEHTAGTREASKELASAMRELATANREQNCLLIFKQEERQSKAADCKLLAR